MLYADVETTLDVNKMSNTWTTNREMFINDQVAIQPASIYVLQIRGGQCNRRNYRA